MFQVPDSTSKMPGRIECFLSIPNLREGPHHCRGIASEDGKNHALVHPFEKPPVSIREGHHSTPHSDLVEWGELDQNGFKLLPCTAISGPVVVVPNVPCEKPEAPPKKKRSKKDVVDVVQPKGGFFVVSNQKQFADFFTNKIILCA